MDRSAIMKEANALVAASVARDRAKGWDVPPSVLRRYRSFHLKHAWLSARLRQPVIDKPQSKEIDLLVQQRDSQPVSFAGNQRWQEINREIMEKRK